MLSKIVSSIKLNPVLVAAVLVAVGQGVAAGDVTTWESLATIVVGVIVRRFVTPEVKAAQRESTAYTLGRLDELYPKNDGPRPI